MTSWIPADQAGVPIASAKRYCELALWSEPVALAPVIVRIRDFNSTRADENVTGVLKVSGASEHHDRMSLTT